MRQPFLILQGKKFEMQVWLVTTVIAAARTFKAVVQDLIGEINPTILVIDVFILVVFLALSVLIYQNKISRVPVVAGLILLALVITSYIQFGGVAGTTEYNLMGLGVLFVLVYDKRPLLWLMIIYFVCILIANLDLRANGWMSSYLLSHYSTRLDNFFTTLIAVAILILFFKNALLAESRRMLELRAKLGSQIRAVRRQHQQLEIQKLELQEANANLELEIKKHTQHIVFQNKAIEDYIRLSTQSLNSPLQNIASETETLRENSFLEEQLKIQVAELNSVVSNLKEELKRHENPR